MKERSPAYGKTAAIRGWDLSLPKEGSAHSYMTLENGCFRWKTMDGRTYHELTLSET